MVENKETQKLQYSIGILWNQDENVQHTVEKYYDDSMEGWRFEVITADSISAILSVASGEYLCVIKSGDEPDYAGLLSIYHMMKANLAAGAYLYDRAAKKAFLYQQGNQTLPVVFLKQAAENHIIYNMDIVRQLDLSEWLEVMKKAGNSYVSDYEVSCCSYLVSLASSVIVGNQKMNKKEEGGIFVFAIAM